MDYQRLGRRIQEKRIAAHFTQEQLAEAIDLSAVFMSQVERGQRKPSLETVVKIATAMKVSVDSLLKDSIEINKDYAVNDFISLIEGRTEEEISTILDTARTILLHMKNNSILK